MAPAYLGIVAVLVIGVAVVAYGWLSDRTANRHRAAQVSGPPDRPIPGRPDDAAEPTYALEPDLLADRRYPHALDETARDHLATQLDDAPALPHGWADEAFVTDPATSWSVLEAPIILVTAEPVTTVRELLPALDRARSQDRSLLIAAPRFADEVLATLAVNAVSQQLRLCAITIPPPAAAELAEHTGTYPVPRADLQAGYLPPASLGHCARFVAGPKRCWVLGG
ncbi:hypothetical protein ATK74_1809 [Propionicimonas paludicola]|uniref:Uncharacterized protein n=1 Tax=Propionicimonas paludicola TaxID=185243 RepID=A0A2A9CSY9_9ACTN|nr:hypothetical protein [Propionicimonas paludicola]PFG17246.1 hypothetical protein ATK74_1809 [Propionicimonas paludicola]